MKMTLRWMAIFLSGLGLGQATEKHAIPTWGGDAGYRFDQERNRCYRCSKFDSDFHCISWDHQRPGLNEGWTGECGGLEFTNFENANLNMLNLTGAELGSANLSGTWLTSTRLSHASLTRATMHSARLKYANLDQVNLHLTDLSRAKILHTSMVGAILTKASLRGTELVEVDMRKAILFGAKLKESIIIFVDFSGALFDSQTTLPFSYESAIEQGMIYVSLHSP